MTSAVYSRTAYEIVKRAFRLIRVTDAELPLEAIERENGFEALNTFVKYLQTEGFNLWRETEGYIPLIKGKQFYDLGPNGDNAFLVDDLIDTTISVNSTGTTPNLASTVGMVGAPELISFNPTASTQDWVITNGTVAVSGNDFTLTNTTQGSASYAVDTTPGTTYIFTFDFKEGTAPSAIMSAEDIDGEISSMTVLTNGSYRLEFTARQNSTNFVFKNSTSSAGVTNTISSLNHVDKSQGDRIGIYLDADTFHWTNIVFTSPFIINEALPSQASVGNQVYTYSNTLDRPMSVTNVRYRRNLAFTDIPTTEWDRDNYFEQPDKTTQGIITKWYYTPQLEKGRLYVWQTADSNLALLPFTFVRPFNITEDNADSPDFPSEWFDLLCFGTANKLSAEYDVPEKALARVGTEYPMLLDQALGFDNDGFVEIEIDYEGRR